MSLFFLGQLAQTLSYEALNNFMMENREGAGREYAPMTSVTPKLKEMSSVFQKYALK